MQGFPAHAGMDPLRARSAPDCCGFPRTRGDGPTESLNFTGSAMVSPHTRGWTLATHPSNRHRKGFPAHAGMDPGQRSGPYRECGFPRTRGDGPGDYSIGRRTVGVSPHTRGWTRCPVSPNPRGAGFPAHAGMDPASRA